MMTTITPPPLDRPPGISAGFDVELQTLINEENGMCATISLAEEPFAETFIFN
jgi:hypothetical protein